MDKGRRSITRAEAIQMHRDLVRGGLLYEAHLLLFGMMWGTVHLGWADAGARALEYEFERRGVTGIITSDAILHVPIRREG